MDEFTTVLDSDLNAESANRWASAIQRKFGWRGLFLALEKRAIEETKEHYHIDPFNCQIAVSLRILRGEEWPTMLTPVTTRNSA